MDEQSEHTQLNDLELLDLVRAGDDSAYSALWLRYRKAGLYAARSFSNSFDPEDVVAEAHSRIFKALQDGKGPTESFRPYLVTTIQNISRRWGQAQADTATTTYDEAIETAAVGDFTETAIDKLTLQRAFRSLPERWQQVLWYLEVEGGTTKELSEALGIRRSAVATLTFRAREGLKQAWIDAHLTQDASKPECQYTIRQLGAYERHTLSRKATARVEQHLAQCESCPSVQIEARQVSQVLKSALLPTLAAGAVAAGAANAALASAPASASAAQGSVASGGKIVSSTVLHASPKVVAAIAASVAVLTGVAVVAATQLQSQPSTPESPSAASQSEQAADPEPPSPSGNNAPPSSSHTPAAANSPAAENSEPIPGQETTLFFVSGPAAPYFHAEDGTILSGPETELTGSALPDARVTLFISGNRSGYQTQTVTANDAGGWDAQISDLAEGDYTVRAYQTDEAGLRSALSSLSYSVEWTDPESAPAVSSIDTAQGTLAPLVSGTGTPGHMVQVLLNGIATTKLISDDGSWSVQANKGAVVGANELSVLQYSPKTKKQSSSTAPTAFTLEAPSASFTAGQPGSLAINISSRPGSSVQLEDLDGGFSHTMLSSSGSDALELEWDSAAGSGSTTAVQLRYTANDGDRLGPVATIFAD